MPLAHKFNLIVVNYALFDLPKLLVNRVGIKWKIDKISDLRFSIGKLRVGCVNLGDEFAVLYFPLNESIDCLTPCTTQFRHCEVMP